MLAIGAWGATSAAASPLVGQEQAARLGLTRSWFAQAPVDPRRSRVSEWLPYFDRVYAITDAGVLASFDASTGATLWTANVGKPGYPAFGPGANEKYLGAVSGDQLYLFDRHDGHLLWSRELGSAPATGPALTNRHAFVALMNGQVESYRISSPETQPWYYQSKGRTFQRPTTTGQVVSWPTAEGLLYVSSAANPKVLFRLETNDEIITSPAEKAPYLYIASLDGYLYCIHELTGRERWRFSTGRPITSSPAVVGDIAYVASTEPAMHAVDTTTGREIWRLPSVEHFVAASEDRVYVIDYRNDLLVVDRETGALEGRLPLHERVTALVNDQTDRIYLVTDAGLLQCLHEAGREEPLRHREPLPAVDETEEETDEVENPFATDEPATAAGPTEENPFAQPAAPSADPAGTEEEAPEDAPPVFNENPFGDFGF